MAQYKKKNPTVDLGKVMPIANGDNIRRSFGLLINMHFSWLDQNRKYHRGKLEGDPVAALCGTVQYTGKGKGQYGYYPSRCADVLCELIEFFEIKSMVDLGCGIGHLIEFLGSIYPGKVFVGYEIEDTLINKNAELFHSGHTSLSPVFKKNIFKLDTKVRRRWKLKSALHCYRAGLQEKFDAIYFYEPFADRTLQKRFIKHVLKNAIRGQYIFYSCASSVTPEFLHTSERTEFIGCYYDIQVWKIIK